MSGEEAGLNLRQEADRDFFLNKRVRDFLGFAFLPGGEDGFSKIIAIDFPSKGLSLSGADLFKPFLFSFLAFPSSIMALRSFEE